MIVTNLGWSQNPAYDQLRFLFTLRMIGSQFIRLFGKFGFPLTQNLDGLNGRQLIDIGNLQTFDNWVGRRFKESQLNPTIRRRVPRR